MHEPSGMAWPLFARASLVIFAVLGAVAAARAQSADEILLRASRLAGLPRDVRLQRIEPDLTGAPDQVGQLDAFLVREPDGRLRRTVYINARSELLLAATSAPDRYVAILASVLFHEWRHLEGDSEGEARAAEQIFLRGLARRGLLTPTEAQWYARQLAAGRPAAP